MGKPRLCVVRNVLHNEHGEQLDDNGNSAEIGLHRVIHACDDHDRADVDIHPNDARWICDELAKVRNAEPMPYRQRAIDQLVEFLEAL